MKARDKKTRDRAINLLRILAQFTEGADAPTLSDAEGRHPSIPCWTAMRNLRDCGAIIEIGIRAYNSDKRQRKCKEIQIPIYKLAGPLDKCIALFSSEYAEKMRERECFYKATKRIAEQDSDESASTTPRQTDEILPGGGFIRKQKDGSRIVRLLTNMPRKSANDTVGLVHAIYGGHASSERVA